MKNYADIQLELRRLANQIEVLSNEIEELKPRDEDEIEIEFMKIDKLSKKHPVCNKQLREQSDLVKKLYFQFLILIANREEINLKEKLLFIQRIASGVSYNKSIIEIFKDGLHLDESFLEDIGENLVEVRDSLILDALIVANIAGGSSEDELTLIADAASMLGCIKEDIAVLSRLACSIIQDDLKIFSGITYSGINKWSGKFLHYISKKWLVENRIICGEYRKPASSGTESKSSYMAGIFALQRAFILEIKKRVKAGTLVKKGDVIIEYEQMSSTKTIIAPKDGMVFLADVKRKSQSGTDEDDVKVYLVSCFDDYNDFCSWLKGTKN